MSLLAGPMLLYICFLLPLCKRTGRLVMVMLWLTMLGAAGMSACWFRL